ncbi:hypothetical protein D917_02823 [Trichinella nativa]|uniref:Uncharacterized protein n=1 Tax=Trichinella nativa TaxID=6335 RepID=A0A1Y3ED12_9BILA|nr:hypothetical protein D917_02823 [Trichinella nativa]
MTRCNGASKTRCKASENFFHQRRRYKDKKTALDGSKFRHRVERIKTDDILHMPDKTQTRSYRPSISLTTCRHNAQHTFKSTLLLHVVPEAKNKTRVPQNGCPF